MSKSSYRQELIMLKKELKDITDPIKVLFFYQEKCEGKYWCPMLHGINTTVFRMIVAKELKTQPLTTIIESIHYEDFGPYLIRVKCGSELAGTVTEFEVVPLDKLKEVLLAEINEQIHVLGVL